MKTIEGRLSAALNLVKLGVNHLVVIGGDGSLTGAERFKTEWPELLRKLLATTRITQEQADAVPTFHIIGMVGSIDNDMCGVSMTIGADTALHRIVAACDALITTAESHQRTFIVEVMGRNCGYLAISAAVAVGADWVFVPESPPEMEDWESALCESLEARRKECNYTLVIVSEGATDRVRRPIEATYIKDVLTKRLGHDTRITTLGHVQRGGAPSAFDRVQGCRLGAEAALAILDAPAGSPSRICGLRWNQVVQIDLTKSVEKTQALGKALEERRFKDAADMRGESFKEIQKIYWQIRSPSVNVKKKPYHIAVLHAGSPAAGMNAAAKVVIRKLLNDGYTVSGVRDGFLGLAQGDLVQMQWSSVGQWSSFGGCKLGTNRVLPENINDGNGPQLIAETIEDFKINGIMVIGGFEAYQGILTLFESRPDHAQLRIPMCCVPATISMNVPGTEISVGADTALNAIVDSIDRLKLSAASSRGRLFLVETMGAYCGYLSTLGAIAGGADAAYIHEEIVSVETMQQDVSYLREKFEMDFKKAVIVRNESCSRFYDMHFMQALFEQEGSRLGTTSFSVRNNVLGHLQQGNSPSPLDRVRAARFGGAGCRWMDHAVTQTAAAGADGVFEANTVDTAVVIGILGPVDTYTTVEELIDQTDFKMRRPKDQWWLKLMPLLRTLELNNRGKWGDDIGYTADSIIVPDDEI